MPLLLILPPIFFNPPPIIHTPLWCPIAIYSHVTDSLVCSDKYSLSLIARRRKGGGGAAGKRGRGKRGWVFLLVEKVKDDREAKLCVYPCFSLFLPASLWWSGGQTGMGGGRWLRWRKGGGGQGKLCWPSCILAIRSRRLVGIGQVWVTLSAGYAVQLCLYVAQAQFGTCITYMPTLKLVCISLASRQVM